LTYTLVITPACEEAYMTATPTTLTTQDVGISNGGITVDTAQIQDPPLSICASTYAATIPDEISSFVTYADNVVTVTGTDDVALAAEYAIAIAVTSAAGNVMAGFELTFTLRIYDGCEVPQLAIAAPDVTLTYTLRDPNPLVVASLWE
jgi:hypothetical protein